MNDTVISDSDNIFDALPALSAPMKAALADELTHYLSAPVEQTLNPLLWWIEKQAIYPHLSLAWLMTTFAFLVSLFLFENGQIYF